MTEVQQPEIGLLGAGGQSLELRGYLRRTVLFFAVDSKFIDGEHGNLVPLEAPSIDERDTEVICAVGAPGQKREMVARWPGRRFATVIADESFVASHLVEVGEGTIVAPQAAIMAGVKIGRHVLINTGAIVSHESVIGDYSTVSPGAILGGRVELGSGVFVGIGATIKDGVKVGEGAVIGAGALVLEEVGEHETVIGVPAKLLRKSEEWLMAI